MKLFLTIIFTLFMIVSLNCIIEWDSEGVAVHQSDNAILEDCAVVLEDGNVVTFWTDTRDGFRALYAQKTDNEGNKLWAEDGLLISESIGIIGEVQAVASTDNSVVISYLLGEGRSEYHIMRLQKISSNGSLSWNSTPEITSDTFISFTKIIASDDGEVTFFWDDYSSNGIKAVRTNHNGTVASGWGNQFNSGDEIGIDVTSLNCYRNYSICSDETDGIIVAFALEDDIYIQHLDADGNKLLGVLGTLVIDNSYTIQIINISNSDENHYFLSYGDTEDKLKMQYLNGNAETVWDVPVILTENLSYNKVETICTNNSEAITVWVHDEDNQKKIYGQKISVTGELLWNESGVLVDEHDENNSFHNFYQPINFDEGCIVAYPRYTLPATGITESVIIQRISSSGELLFGEGGIEVEEQVYDYLISAQLLNTNNNFSLVWSNNNESTIKIQQFNCEGEELFSDTNSTIFSGLYGSIYKFKMLEANDLPLITWIDNRDEENFIYAQKIDNEGDPIFAENGIPISSSGVISYHEYDVDYNDDTEIIATIYETHYNSVTNLYAQATDNFGNHLWDDNGIFLVSDNYSIGDILISSFEEDNWLAGWVEYYSSGGSAIKLQKISDNETVWEENGMEIFSSDHQIDDLVVLDDYIIFSVMESFPTTTFYILRIDENGNTYPCWPTDGLMIDDYTSLFNYSKYFQTSDGLIISWIDRENDELRLQIVRPDGSTFWDEYIAFSGVTNKYDITFNDDIYVCWVDETERWNHSIRVQKISLDGEQLWDETGKEIYAENSTINNLKIENIENNLAIVWSDRHLTYNKNVKIQEINPQGDIIYNEAISIFSPEGYHTKAEIFYNGEHAFVTCETTNSMNVYYEGIDTSYNLYAQKLSLETLGSDEELQLEENLLANYPNPFNPTTTINFSIPENAKEANIEIFNIKGQKIYNQAVILSGDEGRQGEIIWNGTDSNKKSVSSGVYFYKLNIDGKSKATSKMLLIK